jgi:hypothetical protein
MTLLALLALLTLLTLLALLTMLALRAQPRLQCIPVPQDPPVELH